MLLTDRIELSYALCGMLLRNECDCGKRFAFKVWKMFPYKSHSSDTFYTHMYPQNQKSLEFTALWDAMLSLTVLLPIR
jgi:hypothetical protein